MKFSHEQGKLIKLISLSKPYQYLSRRYHQIKRIKLHYFKSLVIAIVEIKN